MLVFPFKLCEIIIFESHLTNHYLRLSSPYHWMSHTDVNALEALFPASWKHWVSGRDCHLKESRAPPISNSRFLMNLYLNYNIVLQLFSTCPVPLHIVQSKECSGW